jgi:filamentous hemagglutinin family protein
VQKVFFPLLQISLCTFGYLYATSNTALAQVTSDSTVDTQVTINGNVSEITGGQTRGGNLFHSFKEFSIPAGNEASFNNADDIQNILSRVTGGSISDIDGLIRANDANLFLINPAGIIFGAGARLDIGGSFLGSTADSILFPEGEFSATDLPTPPLLTVNAPIGLRLRETAGEIVVRGTGNNLSFDSTSLAFSQGETPPGLQVEPGETLALVGNGVKLEGGNLLADGGRIEVGSINSPGLVNLMAGEGGWTLDYSDAVSFQDIELSDRASIDVSSTRGSGSVQIQGRNLTLEGGSAIFAFTGSQPGGTIQVNTSDSIEVTGVAANGQVTSALYTAVSPDGTAKGGDLTLATDRLIARDGAQIGADTYGIGSAGIITVQADESVLLSGTTVDGVFAALGTFVQPGATGSGSQLNLETKRLTIEDGAELITATLGEGSGATLTVKVSSLAELRGTAPNNKGLPSTISSAVLAVPGIETPTGDGGKINLEAGELIVRDGAQVTVSNQGLGDAGDINIVSPSIELSDSGNIVADTASGQGGNITLQTSNLLSLDSQSRISATAAGTGNGGNIKLGIDDTIRLSNSSQISAEATGDGNGGNIDINTKFIIATPNQNSDIIASATEGTGGKITIDAEGIFGIQVRPQSDLTNDIDASGGVDGEVIIYTPDVDITKGLVENPQNVVVEPEQTAAQACAANHEAAAKNGLTIEGKGGVPPEPGLPLNSHNISINGEINPTSTIPEPIETSQGKIQPARGIKVTKDGRVILTAYRTNNAGERLPEIKPNCN